MDREWGLPVGGGLTHCYALGGLVLLNAVEAADGWGWGLGRLVVCNPPFNLWVDSSSTNYHSHPDPLGQSRVSGRLCYDW